MAQECHDRCLAKVDQITNLAKRGAVFGNLGLTYKAQNNDEKALECFERHLALARQAGNREGQGAAFHGLSSFQRDQGNFSAALLSALSSLAIFSDLNVPMAKTLGLFPRIRENLEENVYQNLLEQCLVKQDTDRVKIILKSLTSG